MTMPDVKWRQIEWSDLAVFAIVVLVLLMLLFVSIGVSHPINVD